MSLKELIWGPFCHRCGEKRTRNVDENNNPLCYNCELELEIEAEKKIICPRCHIEMNKKTINFGGTIIIDVCSSCNGIWLDQEELLKIENDVEEQKAIGAACAATGLAIASMNMNMMHR